jgi:predicted transcriptional regulator
MSKKALRMTGLTEEDVCEMTGIPAAALYVFLHGRKSDRILHDEDDRQAMREFLRSCYL